MSRYSLIRAYFAWPIRICPLPNACLHVHPTRLITARILSKAALPSLVVCLRGSREKRRQACGVPPIAVRARTCVQVTRRTPQMCWRAASRVCVGACLHTCTHSSVHALVGHTCMSQHNTLRRCTVRCGGGCPRRASLLVALFAFRAQPSLMHTLQDYVLCAASTALSSIASSSSCCSSMYASRASSSSFSAVFFVSCGFDAA